MILDDAPDFVKDNIIVLARGGSFAYGTMNANSDQDYYGVCLPPKDILYPWDGKYVGFDEATTFLHWKPNGEIDRTIYSLPRFFKLLSQANPNILEMLYYSDDCIVEKHPIWDLIVENRDLFLSKEIYFRFKGWAEANLKKLKSKKSTSSKRIHLHEKFGFDTKDAAHVIRLLYSCLELLEDHIWNIRKYHKSVLAIKNGDWTYESVVSLSEELFGRCTDAFVDSLLPHKPDMARIRHLLERCIGEYYGMG